MIKRKKLIFILALVALMIWGTKKYFYTPTVASSMPEIWVQTTTVATGSLPIEVHAIGSLSARSVDITPEAAGHVKKIRFEDGQFIAAHSPLLLLDDKILSTKYQLAKAKLHYSKTDLKRMRLLFKRGVVSQQAVDQAEADFNEKKANESESRVELEKMQLLAPFEGMVSKCKVNVGDYVSVGQKIVTLTDTKHLHVDYNIPEQYLSSLKLNQKITVISSAFPKQHFPGKVVYIAPTINSENRSINLYAEVENDKNILRPGMFVNIVQHLDTEKNVMMIPVRSLIPVLNGVQVYKVVAGKAQAINVSIGRREQDQIQVTAGLKAGDVVITDGQMKVRPGIAVKIKT